MMQMTEMVVRVVVRVVRVRSEVRPVIQLCDSTCCYRIHFWAECLTSKERVNSAEKNGMKVYLPLGFPGGASGKEPACQCRRCNRFGFNPWVRKILWRRAQQPTPVFLPGEFHIQRNLAGYSPWDCKESDINTHIHFYILGHSYNVYTH